MCMEWVNAANLDYAGHQNRHSEAQNEHPYYSARVLAFVGHRVSGILAGPEAGFKRRYRPDGQRLLRADSINGRSTAAA